MNVLTTDIAVNVGTHAQIAFYDDEYRFDEGKSGASAILWLRSGGNPKSVVLNGIIPFLRCYNVSNLGAGDFAAFFVHHLIAKWNIELGNITLGNGFQRDIDFLYLVCPDRLLIMKVIGFSAKNWRIPIEDDLDDDIEEGDDETPNDEDLPQGNIILDCKLSPPETIFHEIVKLGKAGDDLGPHEIHFHRSGD